MNYTLTKILCAKWTKRSILAQLSQAKLLTMAKTKRGEFFSKVHF